MNIREAIDKIVNRVNLTELETVAVMNQIMTGEATPLQVAAFLTALRMKGETVDEITGAARVMREKAHRVNVAGKTGTADVYDAAAGTYLEDDYNLSFSGFYPADEPQVIMSVYVHKPRVDTSSTYVAAPLFREIGTKAVAAAGQGPAPSAVAQYE